MLIEIENIRGKKKLYQLVNIKTHEIWVNITMLPRTAILCALFDGVTSMKAKVGTKKKEERIFLNLDWCINDWGCKDKELLDLMKSSREKLVAEIPALKEKYKNELVQEN